MSFPLFARGRAAGIDRKIVGVLATPTADSSAAADHFEVWESRATSKRHGYPPAAYLSFDSPAYAGHASSRICDSEPGHSQSVLFLSRGQLSCAAGDVVAIYPGGEIRLLFSREATHNSLLVTERCNSFCVMCSQPPRKTDNDDLLLECQRTLSLIDPATKAVGLSGGEPTLLGVGFTSLIATARDFLPQSILHVLSNGRLLRESTFAREIASVGHPRLLFGIPLYSANPSRHDYVVQARGAFRETVRGLMNLGGFGIEIELRFVMHRETRTELVDLASYVARHLPFVATVSIMDLEPMGFARPNWECLRLDPHEYHSELREALAVFESGGIHSQLLNFPLCHLPSDVRRHATQSISDWKNEYLAECSCCRAKDSCCGFFESRLRILPPPLALPLKSIGSFSSDN